MRRHPAFVFSEADIGDQASVAVLFRRHAFRRVIHLAAQAGVRYSIEAPQDYVAANIAGFTVVLECCARHSVEHLIYASSSSVYGDSERTPFAVEDAADRPRNVYAASKRAGELLAYAYARIHGLSSTGIRYFTVYGPWGRPDMAPMIFAQRLRAGRVLEVYGDGQQRRAFTYINDAVEGTLAILDAPPPAGPPPAALYNLGSSEDVELLEFLRLLAGELGSTARLEFSPSPPGEMRITLPDMSAMQRDFGFEPRVGLRDGLAKFARWFIDFEGSVRSGPQRG